MKTKNIIILALTALLAVACDEWDAPKSLTAGMDSYGNPNIEATNLKTIAELKALYKNEITNNGMKQVDKPLQIRGTVVGNDECGNIYQYLYIQDETGGMALRVDQGGLYAAFAEGQTLMVELEGLYIGGYGKQPQIGTTYTDPTKEAATPQIGRMNRYTWANHFKFIPKTEDLTIEPLVVRKASKLDLDADCGKLITLRGVEIVEANGTAVFAPKDDPTAVKSGSNIHRSIKDQSNVVIRTSQSADFANKVMPTGKVDITGIFTRYNDTWQILMRTDKDVQPSNAEDLPTIPPTGDGSAAKPYNVTAINQAYATLESGKTADKEVYVKGYVMANPKFDSKYNSMNYYICDDKEGDGQVFYIYGGRGLNNTTFSSANDLKEGDEVIICGKVTNYKGALQLASQNKIVQLNGKNADDYTGEDNTGGGGDSGNSYSKVTTMAPGNYIIAALYEGSTYAIANPLAADKTYGYPTKTDVTANEGTFEADAANEFTIKSVTGGYTIQDASGRFYYCDGTYKTCSVTSTQDSKCIWSITIDSNGLATIKSTNNQRVMYYSVTYKSWGFYDSATDDYKLPTLFKK